jgi:hypothetical protein
MESEHGDCPQTSVNVQTDYEEMDDDSEVGCAEVGLFYLNSIDCISRTKR